MTAATTHGQLWCGRLAVDLLVRAHDVARSCPAGLAPDIDAQITRRIRTSRELAEVGSLRELARQAINVEALCRRGDHLTVRGIQAGELAMAAWSAALLWGAPREGGARRYYLEAELVAVVDLLDPLLARKRELSEFDATTIVLIESGLDVDGACIAAELLLGTDET